MSAAPSVAAGLDPALAGATRAYRVKRAGARAALQAQMTRLWESYYEPGNPLPSIAQVSKMAGHWVLAGQKIAKQDAMAYLAQLVAAKHGVPVSEIAPFAAPNIELGWSAAGKSIYALTGYTENVWIKQQLVAGDEAKAAQSAQAFLQAVAASEPTRIGNVSMLDAAGSDPRLTGRFYRVTRPGACKFCVMIAERGYTYANVGFLAHRNCSCTPQPEPAYHASPAKPGKPKPPALHPVAAAVPVLPGLAAVPDVLPPPTLPPAAAGPMAAQYGLPDVPLRDDPVIHGYSALTVPQTKAAVRASKNAGVESYQGAGYGPINTYHREGGQLPGFFTERNLAETRSSIDDIEAGWHAAPQKMEMYRGTGSLDKVLAGEDVSKSLVGVEGTFQGYVSTSADVRVAETFSIGKGKDLPYDTVMHVQLPAGNKVQRLTGMGEAELLLPHGTRFRVVDDVVTAAKGRTDRWGNRMTRPTRYLTLQVAPDPVLR